jgi:preprotein translocase subunit SecY
MMPFLGLAVIAAVVFLQEGQRRIPIQYAKRVIGRRMTQGGQTYLPLRVNMAGVIPVIFAASIMAFPPTIGQLTQAKFGEDIASFFAPSGWAYIVGETIFIILFTYFYTAVTFNPVDQADNLKKYGGFIPGIRPGKATETYFDYLVTRLTVVGAAYLVLICLIPEFLFSQAGVPFYLGGTSLLIVVNVTMDTVAQIQSHLIAHQYGDLIKKAKLKTGRRR